jgi:hypothetical protein
MGCRHKGITMGSQCICCWRHRALQAERKIVLMEQAMRDNMYPGQLVKAEEQIDRVVAGENGGDDECSG